MIERSFDGEFINRIVNDPAVFPYLCLGMKGPIDLAPAVEDQSNYFLANEWGGFIFMNFGEGMYELHSQFLPEGRGASAGDAAVEALRYMFGKTDCLAIRTFIPFENRAARAYAVKNGFYPVERSSLMGAEGEVYFFTIKDWARQLCQQQQ